MLRRKSQKALQMESHWRFDVFSHSEKLLVNFFCLTCCHCMVHIDNVQHNTLQFGKEKATATYGVLPAANVPPPYALASISAVQFDHYGHRFATAALDGTVCTWQLEVGGRSNIHPTESCLCLNGHASYVYRSFYFARLHWSHTGFLGTVEGVQGTDSKCTWSKRSLNSPKQWKKLPQTLAGSFLLWECPFF